ncbi:hypothetical protein ACGYKB_17400 [Sulfitobacter sp. 916]
MSALLLGFAKNEAAISEEAEQVETSGVPGSDLTLNHPLPDPEVRRF